MVTIYVREADDWKIRVAYLPTPLFKEGRICYHCVGDDSKILSGPLLRMLLATRQILKRVGSDYFPTALQKLYGGPET